MGVGAIEVRLLGRFAVAIDGAELPPGVFGGRLVRTMVRLLVTRRGSFVARDVLAEALWPGRAPADPGANLEVLVSRARRALRDPSLIRAGGGGYVLVRDARCAVDAERVLARVEAGQRAVAAGQNGAALAEFQAALDAWSGEPLPEDAYAEWAQPYRRELSRAHLAALEEGAAAALDEGLAGRAAALAERAVAEEPLRETGHLLLARALAASGDAAGGLAALARLRAQLADELGLDPSAEFARVEEGILRGEPRSGFTPRGQREPPLQPLPGPGIQAPGRFVGRQAVLAATLAWFRSAPATVVLVSGRSGSGKTRLLAEVARELGAPTIAARAFHGEAGEPWALARSLLRECLALDVGPIGQLPDRAVQALAGIVPEVEEIRPVASRPQDPESGRALALEGALRLLVAAGSAGALVIADDLQWADPTSLHLLAQFLGRSPRLRLALAYRPEEVEPGSPVSGFLAGLEGLCAAVETVALGALDPAALGDLVADPQLARALSDATDGTPSAVIETLRELAVRGAALPDAAGRWHARDPQAAELARQAAGAGQRRAIAARVRWQPPRRGRLLQVLAILGREAPPALLETAVGGGIGVVLDDLDALARAALVRAGEDGWATAHDSVAETVAGDLEPGARARIHALLAGALRASGAEAWELATHAAAAGDADTAAPLYVTAARSALDRFASTEAERLAATGIALRPRREVRAALLAGRSEARGHLGDLEGAGDDLRAAIALTPAGPERARLMARLAMAISGSADLARAADLVGLALVESGADLGARAYALYVGAIVDMNLGLVERSDEGFAAALGLYEEAGDAGGVADILDGRAMSGLMQGRVAEAVEALGRVAGLFLDCGQLLRVIWPLGARAAGLGWMLRGEEGLIEADRVLELARMLGHREGESYGLLERSLTLTALGREDEALADAAAALSIAQELGHAEWTAGSLLALGGALAGAGRPEAARDALLRSLAVAESGHLAHFESWAAALLAQVLVGLGDLAGAEPLAALAWAKGTPITRYDAAIAAATLAGARGEEAPPEAREAYTKALAGGHLAAARRLEALLRP